MPNYKISIQYDGSDYFGWQSQPSGRTIQDNIIKSIHQITHQKINLIGSGRTDSGVHAFGQVANFNLESEIDEFKFKKSLNSLLPSDISIKEIEQVNDSFHARFDARKRSYLYFINQEKSPFFSKFSYQYPYFSKIDLIRLRSLSDALIGENDYTSFCKANSDTENKICNIYEINWKMTRDLLIFKIEANRFLHGMVRTIVGTLLSLSLNSAAPAAIEKILIDKTRTSAGESAPAKGLFLFKVKY
ncbi:MAG: tRNA pseudouridine(38-40) synthase TruA [Melioribacteraceae bacterium]|nr:tRNA pseudouridine(38-40) synthase TruA [Melioribacteraceae bacterium]